MSFLCHKNRRIISTNYFSTFHSSHRNQPMRFIGSIWTEKKKTIYFDSIRKVKRITFVKKICRTLFLSCTRSIRVDTRDISNESIKRRSINVGNGWFLSLKSKTTNQKLNAHDWHWVWLNGRSNSGVFYWWRFTRRAHHIRNGSHRSANRWANSIEWIHSNNDKYFQSQFQWSPNFHPSNEYRWRIRNTEFIYL